MKSNIVFFTIVLLIGCMTSIASDIYAPSVPAIANSLSTDIASVQLTMAIFLFGIACSQLIYGPISEGVGRKSPLMVGIGIMALGSFIALFSPNIKTLILGRFIQGCGAGACAALWRTIFRDVFTGDDLAKWGSYLAVVITFVVPAAPALGGYLQEYFDWRASFVFITAYTLLALFLVGLGYKETSQYHHPERLKMSFVGKTYRILFTNRLFMGVTACTFLAYGGLFACIIAAPVFLIDKLGLTPVQFGWITFLGCGAAYGIAGWLNGRFVTRYGRHAMMRFGFSIMLLSGSLMFIGYFLSGVTLLVIIAPIILFYFGSTFIWPNAFATAFTPFGDIAGYAGSAYGFMQLAGGAVIGSVISHLPEENQLPLALVLLSSSLLAWFFYETFSVRKT